ncbi:MAG: cupin domain-containing protein, partial [Geminicoccaceae bacterium]|nr:cupin domain-containing protein [Geminicoccaceae bacterium]
LPAGRTAKAVRHRSVEELWYVIAGEGEMWRRLGDREEIVRLRPGVALSIPVGTVFQFRNTGTAPLDVVLVTMPPWPGAEEAIEENGPWTPG